MVSEPEQGLVDEFVDHYLDTGKYPDKAWLAHNKAERLAANAEIRRHGLNPPRQGITGERVGLGVVVVLVVGMTLYSCASGSGTDTGGCLPSNVPPFGMEC